MGTKDDIHSLLGESPLHGRLGSSEGDTLRTDLLDVGTFLGKMVEDLRALHRAVVTIAERVDELERERERLAA